MQNFKRVPEIQSWFIEQAKGRLDSLAAKALRNTRFKSSNKVDDPVSLDEFENMIKECFGEFKQLEIGKSEGQSGSSKFFGYEVDLLIKDHPKKAVLLLANGANKGEEYEQFVLSELQNKTEWSTHIYSDLKINMDNVESVDFAGAEGTRREDLFDLEKGLAGISPKKFGKTIADIIITDTYDHEIYL